MNLQEILATRLAEVQGDKVANVSVKLGIIEDSLLQIFAQKLGINKSKFIKAAIGHYSSYIDSLNKKEFLQELIELKKG